MNTKQQYQNSVCKAFPRQTTYAKKPQALTANSPIKIVTFTSLHLQKVCLKGDFFSIPISNRPD